MNKAELKQTLHDQFLPFEQAVQNKLKYLQSDDVFNVDGYVGYNNIHTGDDSLENAFSEAFSAPSIPVYRTPTVAEYRQMQQTSQPSYAGEAPSADSVAAHKQNIAARIAALRGISMPGDYLGGRK